VTATLSSITLAGSGVGLGAGAGAGEGAGAGAGLAQAVKKDDTINTRTNKKKHALFFIYFSSLPGILQIPIGQLIINLTSLFHLLYNIVIWYIYLQYIKMSW
jgi:hypothetical protein